MAYRIALILITLSDLKLQVHLPVLQAFHKRFFRTVAAVDKNLTVSPSVVLELEHNDSLVACN